MRVRDLLVLEATPFTERGRVRERKGLVTQQLLLICHRGTQLLICHRGTQLLTCHRGTQLLICHRGTQILWSTVNTMPNFAQIWLVTAVFFHGDNSMVTECHSSSSFSKGTDWRHTMLMTSRLCWAHSSGGAEGRGLHPLFLTVFMSLGKVGTLPSYFILQGLVSISWFSFCWQNTASNIWTLSSVCGMYVIFVQ